MHGLEGYKSNHNVVYSSKYDVVWTTKYRRSVLGGAIVKRCGAVIRQVAAKYRAEIIAMELMAEPVHLRCEVDRNPAKLHHRTAHLRAEFLHQLSHQLVEKWDALCLEDLPLKTLAQTKHAKSWLDAAFGELLWEMEYKFRCNRKHFVQVDRFFPSSELCSECGYKHNDLALWDRQSRYPACETEHVRDLNAAINIRDEGLKILAAGTPESINAHGQQVRLAAASTAE